MELLHSWEGEILKLRKNILYSYVFINDEYDSERKMAILIET